ncbi:MAG: LamG-like jellyroll fold domain-containing protein [Planctomycetota bacterium]
MTGNHNGTLMGGATIATDPEREGQVLVLDGTEDYVDVPDTVLNASEGTVSAWFKLDDIPSSGNEFIFGSVGGGARNRVYLYVRTSGELVARLDASSAFGQTIVTPNRWYHVQLVWRQDNTGELFVDGQSVGVTANLAFNSGIQNDRVRIGSLESQGLYFDGRIDDVRVYDAAVEPPVILGPPSWTSTVAGASSDSYEFTDDGTYTLTVTARDDDGGLDKSVTTIVVDNVAPTINDLNHVANGSGLVGDALSFDARDVMDFDPTSELSYRWDVTSNNGQQILSSDELEFSFKPDYAGEYTVTLTVFDEDGGETSQSQSFDVEPMAMIDQADDVPAFTGTQGQVVQLTSATSSHLAPAGLLRGTGETVTRSYLWTVTAPDTSTQNFSTKNIELVPLEAGNYSVTLRITDNFSTGTTSLSNTSDPFTLNVDAAGAITINGPTTAVEGDVLTFSIEELEPIGNFLSRDIVWNITPSTFEIVPVEDPETFSIRALADDSYTVSVSVNDKFPLGIPDGPIAHYTFDDGTANDQSGNGADGTLQDDAMIVNNAVQLDGVDDWVDLPDNLLQGSQGAISARFQMEESPAGIQMIVATDAPERLYLEVDSSSNLRARVDETSTTFGHTPVTVGQWYDVTLVWRSDSTAEFFVDGQSRGSASNLTLTNAIANELSIGSFSDGQALFFNGQIDDVVIYDRALTPAEVNQLHSSFVRTATLNPITIGNSAPTIVVNAVQGNEGSTVTLTATVTDSDTSDIDDHDYVIDWGDGNSDPITNVNSGAISATHTYGQDGHYTATITVDGGGLANSFDVDVDVVIANVAPMGVNDTGATNEDTPLTLTDLAGNDTDAGSDTLSVFSIDPFSASGATLTLQPNGSVIYDPTTSETLNALKQSTNTTDTFGYVVSDGDGGFDTGVVTITVSGVNDRTSAIRDLFVITENSSGVTGENLLTNDADVDRDPLTVSSVVRIDNPDDSTEYGSLVFNSDGSFTYTLNPIAQSLTAGQTIDERFIYRAADALTTDESTLTITVVGVNDVPVSADDTGAIDANAVLNTPTATGLLSNDSDAEDEATELSITAINGIEANVGVTLELESGAILRVKADGEYEYDPNAAFDYLPLNQTALEKFTYTVSDQDGGTSTSTVGITITGQNEAPTRVELSQSVVTADAAAMTAVGNVAASDADANDQVTITIDPNMDGDDRFAILNNQLVANREFNSEDEGTYLLKLIADDGDATIDQFFTVTIAPPPVDPTLEVNPGATENDLTVHIVDIDGESFVQVINDFNGEVLSSQPLSLTHSLSIRGTDNVADSLKIDYASGGYFELAGGISFEGGQGDGDTIEILGNRTSTDGALSFAPAADGNPATFTLAATDGSDSGSAHFSNVDTIEIKDLRQLRFSGNIDLGTSTVTLDVEGAINLGDLTTLSGGTIHSASPISIGSDETLNAFGTIDAVIIGQTASTINATGNLTVGDATSPAGFVTEGTLSVDSHTVTLLDSNQVELGTLTTLSGGTIVAANGLLIESGSNVSGVGAIDSPDNLFQPVRNNGAMSGVFFGQELELTGFVKGIGSFDFVFVSGTFAPGLSPSIVNIGSVRLNDVEIEIGGTSPGFTNGSHDQINSSGSVLLEGELIVIPFNSFEASIGDTFTVLTVQNTIVGEFTNAPEGATLPFGDVDLRVNYVGNEVILTAVASTGVPGPTVENVKLGASSWQSFVTSHIDATQGRGFDIPWDGTQLNPLSWEGIDTIYVDFSEDVSDTFTAANVRLEGVAVTNYASQIASVTYIEATDTGVITLSTPLGRDRVRLTVTESVSNAAGRKLDGNFVAGSDVARSGDGNEGGDFVFDFNVLPGDLNNDGVVNVGDLTVYDNAFFSEPGDGNYVAAADVNGDGLVTIGDLLPFSDHFSQGVPSGTAGVTAASGASLQVVAQSSEQVVIIDDTNFDPQPLGEPISLPSTVRDDVIQLDTSSELRVSVDAGAGLDRLAPLTEGQDIDLPQRLQQGELVSIEVVDLTGFGENRLSLDAASIAAMVPTSRTLMVDLDTGDSIESPDVFEITETRVAAGKLHVVARSGNVILQISGAGWTNPLDRYDVDASGDVSAVDALRIINQINSRSAGGSGQGVELGDPALPGAFRSQFYDTSGDGRLSALDALRVINELNRRPSSNANTLPSSEPTPQTETLVAIADSALMTMPPPSDVPIVSVASQASHREWSRDQVFASKETTAALEVAWDAPASIATQTDRDTVDQTIEKERDQAIASLSKSRDARLDQAIEALTSNLAASGNGESDV